MAPELEEHGAAARRLEEGAGLLQLEALFRGQVGVSIQGGVDRVREKGVKLIVHHPTLLPGEIDDRRSRLGSWGRSRSRRRS